MHQQYQLKKALQLMENVNKRKAFDKMKLTDTEKAVIRHKQNEEDKKRHQEINKFKTPGKTANDMQEDMDKFTKNERSIEELINSTKKILDASKEKNDSRLKEKETREESRKKYLEYYSELEREQKQLANDLKTIKEFDELTQDISDPQTDIKNNTQHRKAYNVIKPFLEKAPNVKKIGSIRSHIEKFQTTRINKVNELKIKMEQAKNETKPKTQSYVSRDASYFENSSEGGSKSSIPSKK